MGANAFALAARKVNPNVTVKVVYIDSWFDPPKEAEQARALIDQGIDVIAQHTDGPVIPQIAEERGIVGVFGQGADMSAFAPKGGRAYGGSSSAAVGRNTGLWPNQQDSRLVPAGASLIGEHFVHGNLVPHIKFSMDAKHDIMKALAVTTQGQSQADAIVVRWNKLPTAIGYHVMAIGTNSSGKEMVMWTSSETPNVNVSGQFIDTAQVNKHISSKVILPADRDSCIIPRGIFAASSPPMIMVTAWGADYWAGFPPRPANAPKDWKPDWSVRGQFLSTANTMFGMPARGAEYNVPDSGPGGGEHAPRGRDKAPGDVAPDVVRGILRGIF
jgi:hypothetical protein